MVLNDIVLEQKLLCLLFEHKRVSFNLQQSDFYSTAHQNIYRAFLDGTFDLSISSDAERYSVDSVAFFKCLETSEFSFSNIKPFEAKLSELATRRRKIKEYEAFIAQMNNPEFEVVSDSIPVSDNKESMKEHVMNEWKVKNKIELGQFYALSDKIQTFNPGHVMLLAGTSGTGKTNVAIQLCEDICECNNGEEWLFMSLEMAKHDVIKRCGQIRYYELHPQGTRYESNVFFDQNRSNPHFYDSVSPKHMNICDDTGLTIDRMKQIVKYEVTKNPKIKTVVIDYAQLVKGKGSLFEKMSYISVMCPIIAKEYGVRVILLCQLNKDSYDNQRPLISAIKGAGDLYDNSDIVLCLYKDRSIEDNKVLEILHWKDRPSGSEGITCMKINGLHVHS